MTPASSRPRLTREQLEQVRAAWASFTDPAWAPFREAWQARGLLLPPRGSASDDPDNSLRARLWQIVSPEHGGQSQRVARWVAEAPGTTAWDVVEHVFREFAARRESYGVDDDAWALAKAEERRGASKALARITDVLGGTDQAELVKARAELVEARARIEALERELAEVRGALLQARQGDGATARRVA